MDSSKKKILIVSRSFYPSVNPRATRATELVKELGRQGHNVVVYIPFSGNTYDEFSSKYGVTFKDLGKLRWPVIRLKGGKWAELISRGLSRSLGLLFEYPNIELMFKVKKALIKENNYNLLISIATPYTIHWGVALCRTKAHSIADIWIADCGDPYMINYIDSFKKPFYFEYVEKWFSRKTDFITIPRIEMIDTFYPEFHSKIRAIPQGVSFDNVRLHEGPVSNKVPTFGYAGNFIKGTRDPSKLLEFLVSLEHNFKFIVYTSTKSLIYPYINRLGVKLEVKDFIPRSDVLYELSKMDFLINIGYDPVTQSPSKLIDYGLTKRPILSLQSNQVDEKVFGEFLKGNYSNRFEINNLGKFDVRNVVRQFLDLMN